jgi:hypothetical protein
MTGFELAEIAKLDLEICEKVDHDINWSLVWRLVAQLQNDCS